MVSTLSRRLESKIVQKVRQSQQVSSTQARVPCPLCYATRLAERERGFVDTGLEGQGCRVERARGTTTLIYFLPAQHSVSLWLTLQFSSIQLLSRIWLFVTPWTAARQSSLSIANFRNLLKLMSIESVMPSNHLILCHSLLLPPSIFSSIRVSWVSSSCQVAKAFEFQFQHQSFQ